MTTATFRSLLAASTAVLMLGQFTISAEAAEPASGADITGKTVYAAPNARLRYGKSIILNRVYSRTNAYLELKGTGPCTAFNCPVVHNKVDLFARRSQLDDAKPSGTIVTERTLRNGDDGDDVKVMQQVLIKKGYQIKDDGKFGSDTEKAVSDFQKKNGIPVDGEIGAATRGKLSV